MAEKNTAHFSFVSDAFAKDTFQVVKFSGEEGLGEMFSFSISLVSQKGDLDLRQAVQQDATFTIHGREHDFPFKGILEHFELEHHYNALYFYKAVLRPKLWWLTLTQHNQLFLNKKSTDFIQSALQDGGLNPGQDFQLQLTGQYQPWEYVCQYGESHFNFISRWMEHEGMYYYFEPDTGKLMITDSGDAHSAMKQVQSNNGAVRYLPPSGLNRPRDVEALSSFSLRQHVLPGSVRIKDYNYRTPNLNIEGHADVSKQGGGEVFTYAEHVRTPSEANHLARLRAQELICGEKQYHGRGDTPAIRSGYTFQVQGHYLDDMNDAYLAVSVRHEGDQTGYLVSGLGMQLAPSHGEEGDEKLFYKNTFIAIPANVQFRPRRMTPKPRLHGVMNAYVDAGGSGKYAEIDDQGRYKVILPFDLSGRKDGRASSWIRMAQPYGGADHGLHFPLHKGTEVLLTFIDGDVDRPIIAAAVPNPNHKSQISQENQTKAMLTTGGQNKIHFEDKEGSERILLQTPTTDAFFRIGASNDPPSPAAEDEEEPGFIGHHIYTSGLMEINAGSENKVCMIEASTNVLGICHKTVVVAATEINLALMLMYHDPWSKEWTPIQSKIKSKRFKTAGINEKVYEENEEIANDIVKLYGMKKKVAAQSTKLTQSKTDISETKDTLTEQKTALEQEVVQLREQDTALRQECVQVTQERTRVSEEVTELRQSVTEMAEMKAQLVQELTELSETADQLGELLTKAYVERTSIKADFNRLAANVTRV